MPRNYPAERRKRNSAQTEALAALKAPHWTKPEPPIVVEVAPERHVIISGEESRQRRKPTMWGSMHHAAAIRGIGR